MKYNIVISDPPWDFSDKLEMSDVKRGAAANYDIMTNQDILDLKVKDITENDAVLVLWVPSSLLQLGLDVMKKWGFAHKQTLPWVKLKKDPFEKIKQLLKSNTLSNKEIDACFDNFDYNNLLNFGMGRLFRQSHEIALIGVKGKIYSKLQNKSQRSVIFGVNEKHSKKPDLLQDKLELMFPDCVGHFLEMFARRDKPNWTCIGNQCPSSFGEDIRVSLERIAKL